MARKARVLGRGGDKEEYLDYESKLNRDRALVQEMTAYGEEQAEELLKELT